jgi:DNA-directed RNA polymerase subunit RPC12/RpoP
MINDLESFMIKVSMTTKRTGSSLVDGVTFPIKCPNCSYETKQSVSRLQNDLVIACPSCSKSFKVETQGTGQKIADQLRDLDRQLDNLFK